MLFRLKFNNKNSGSSDHRRHINPVILYVSVANFWRGSEIAELLMQRHGLPAKTIGVYRPKCVLSTWTYDADNWCKEFAADRNISDNNFSCPDYLFQVSMWKIKEWSLPAKDYTAVFRLVGGRRVGNPRCSTNHEELWDSIHYVSC